MLPTLDGPHTVVVNAWIDVPETGHYKTHAGFGESSHAITIHEGRQVYQGPPANPPNTKLSCSNPANVTKSPSHS